MREGLVDLAQRALEPVLADPDDGAHQRAFDLVRERGAGGGRGEAAVGERGGRGGEGEQYDALREANAGAE